MPTINLSDEVDRSHTQRQIASLNALKAKQPKEGEAQLAAEEKKVLEELIHEEDNSNIAVSHGSFDVKQSLLILEDLLDEGE